MLASDPPPAGEGEEDVEAKVLVAERVYGEMSSADVGQHPSWMQWVKAEAIADHVREGWTVEAVQWSETPGEAMCVVLRRER